MVWDVNDNGKKPESNQKKIDNLEDLLKKGAENFKNKMSNNSGDDGKFFHKFVAMAMGILGILWLASGFYIVEEDEQGIVKRFGKFARIAYPGPNYHMPFPIETSNTYKVTMHQIEEFGYRTSQIDNMQRLMGVSSKRPDTRNIPEESLMLTGDENIADINFLVKWQIDNIKDFVFNIENPRETVRMAAESAVREVIGNTQFAEAQTMGRSKVEEKSMIILQTMLDLYKSGIKIVELQMLKFDPPQEVIDAFKDVQTARADKEKLINDAFTYRNGIIPEARGKARKLEQDALAYKQEVISASQGEAARYKSIYDQYKNAKDIIRKRMLLETMESTLGDVSKLIVDKNMKNFTPYMPLKELQPKNGNKNGN